MVVLYAFATRFILYPIDPACILAMQHDIHGNMKKHLQVITTSRNMGIMYSGEGNTPRECFSQIFHPKLGFHNLLICNMTWIKPNRSDINPKRFCMKLHSIHDSRSLTVGRDVIPTILMRAKERIAKSNAA